MAKKIGITIGDKLGIGEEIVIKALSELKLDKNEVIIIGKPILDYDFVEIKDKNNGDFCFNSLKIACEMAKKGEISALVTAPVSKEALFKSGHKFSGQTEILEKYLSENENEKAEMLFIARDLRVMLLTRHLALKDIKISEEMIIKKTKTLYKFLKEKCKIDEPNIAMCALNPHAGEAGILGSEEIEIINPACKKLNKMGIKITNAMPADALFARVGKEFLQNKKISYDTIIANYHDQGLCPLKALCADDAVNTTIGLKIVRTSPSHGTAYDIAGKNIANPKSMIEAILLAKKLA